MSARKSKLWGVLNSQTRLRSGHKQTERTVNDFGAQNSNGAGDDSTRAEKWGGEGVGAGVAAEKSTKSNKGIEKETHEKQRIEHDVNGPAAVKSSALRQRYSFEFKTEVMQQINR